MSFDDMLESGGIILQDFREPYSVAHGHGRNDGRLHQAELEVRRANLIAIIDSNNVDVSLWREKLPNFANGNGFFH